MACHPRFSYAHVRSWGYLERIVETYRHELLELEVPMMVVAHRAVVEPWVDEEFGRDVLVELEGEGVLPLPLHSLER